MQKAFFSAQSAPSLAVVQLIGRRTYEKGMGDLYELLQSPVLLRQVGYGLAEVVVAGLFPELKGLVLEVQRGHV